LKNQTSGLTYQATSLDFSGVFREHVAEHKNLWGILKNQMPTSMGIPISSISCLLFVPEIPHGNLAGTPRTS